MYKRLIGPTIKFCRHHCFLYWDIIVHLDISCKLFLGKTLFNFRFCILFSPNSSSKKQWETWKYPGYQSKSCIKTANMLLWLGRNKARPHYLPRSFFLDWGYLPFTWKNRRSRLENQMVRANPFRKLRERWTVIWGGAIVLLFLIFSADLDILCGGLFSHHVKFYSIMFMHKISTRVVCVHVYYILQFLYTSPLIN